MQAGRREGVGRRQREQRASRTQLWRLHEGRARAERTLNMPFMPVFVTLDVSQLSGWLKAVACCRVEREA